MLEFPSNQERVRYAAPARAVVLVHVRIPPVNPFDWAWMWLRVEKLLSQATVSVKECSFVRVLQTLQDVSGVE